MGLQRAEAVEEQSGALEISFRYQ